MQIQKSGKATDLFVDELKRLMPVEADKKVPECCTTEEVKLEKDRDEKKQEAEASGTTEVQLAPEQKKDLGQDTYETLLEPLRKEKKTTAQVTETRLNNDDKKGYPHRNPDAWERTGDKRPINALKEEMGDASDEGKRERQTQAEKQNKAAPRVLDKDIGSQLTNPKTKLKNKGLTKAFNLKQNKTSSAKYNDYLLYRNAAESNVKTASFSEVKQIDSEMSGIMEKAQKEDRLLNQEEMARVVALKQKKSSLLRMG